MQDHPTDGLDHGAESDDDFYVLDLLIEDDDKRPWSIEEVGREVGDLPKAESALTRLGAAGLVHRLDGFVFPSRSALRYARLHG